MKDEPFSRSRGGFTVTLAEPEVEVLRGVALEVRMIVEAGERPEFARRLFPPAYPDDEAAQAEYAGLMGDDLSRQKLAAFETLERTLAGGKSKRGRWTTSLSDDEVQAWLGVINDARLTLGTQLDVTEDDFEKALDSSAPDAHARAVYYWLGWLEEHLVATLMS